MQMTASAALLAGAVALVAAPVTADTWRMSHKMPAESVEGQLFQLFADLIEERTDITVQVFPSEQLGTDDAVLEQLQLGTVHLYPEGISYLQKWVPEIRFVSAPFLFEDRDHWSRFMESDLVAGWLEQIEEEAGITMIGDPTAFVRGPFRVMLSSREWDSLDDMQGLRLRMHPDELAAESWRHLGAEVRTLAWTETYESIGRGIVEAVNSPAALVESMRFYEVAPHVVRHDEYPQGMAFMTSAVVWNALDDETKALVLEAHEEMAAESARVMGEIADETIANITDRGATFRVADTTEFVERMLEMYERMSEAGELPEGFLETVEATR